MSLKFPFLDCRKNAIELLTYFTHSERFSSSLLFTEAFEYLKDLLSYFVLLNFGVTVCLDFSSKYSRHVWNVVEIG